MPFLYFLRKQLHFYLFLLLLVLLLLAQSVTQTLQIRTDLLAAAKTTTALQRHRSGANSHGVYVTSKHLFGGKTQRCRTDGEQSVNVKNVENAFRWAQIVRCIAEICTRAAVVVVICLCHSWCKAVNSKLSWPICYCFKWKIFGKYPVFSEKFLTAKNFKISL